MKDLALENIRIDPEIGDGIAFTVDIHGAAHRFCVSRDTLGDVERTLLTDQGWTLAGLGPRVLRTETACALAIGIATLKGWV